MSALKTHVALKVTDLEQSAAFYQAMFGVAPVKHKADYAKFDIANPGLNLTLNLSSNRSSDGPLSHLGVQVETTEDVQAATRRFREAGLPVSIEEDTNCCYALQDKVWVSDPDGNHWEIFTIKVADTAPEKEVSALVSSPATSAPATESSCCA